ncbi:helix-turn-helix transcriptional regulator [Nocardia panacis]|nr:LuxR C-terminal-related transcriptional regulator [Nocardia panacis]
MRQLQDLGILAEIAAKAAQPLSAVERARSVLAAMHGLVPYAGGGLSAWDPIGETYRPVVNIGYDAPTFSTLHTHRYLDEYRRLGLLDEPKALRFRDVPGRGRDLRTFQELVAPAGYREGLGLALLAPDGRRVGILTLSTVDVRYPSVRQRDLSELLGPTLAALLDPVGRLAESFGAGQLWAITQSAARRLDGGSLLGRNSLREQLIRLVANGVDQAEFRWRDESGGWERVRMLAPTAELGLACRSIAVVTPAPQPYRLTWRELEVVTLIARGYDNRRVAQTLGASVRTVTTHVERILTKVQVRSRTELAVRAVHEGLLVCVDGEPPAACY